MTRTNSSAFILCLITMLLAGSGCGTTHTARQNGNEGRKERGNPSTEQQGTTRPGKLKQLWIGDEELWLEVAHDTQSRALGLSGRKELGERQGMVFVYPMAQDRSFWMKNTWVSLDVAFVSDDMKITRVVSLDPPAPDCSDIDMPRARSQGPARHVIEMRKGWFQAHGLGAGSPVRFSPALEAMVGGTEY